MDKSKAYLTKRFMVSAMHDLRSPTLSDKENKEIFGKCFNLHGHDYYIEVTVKGEIDKDSGLICDRDFFEDVLENEIRRKYSLTFLNDHFRLTTGENMVREFYDILEKKLKPLELVRVGLQETPKNLFTYGKSVDSNLPRFL